MNEIDCTANLIEIFVCSMQVSADLMRLWPTSSQQTSIGCYSIFENCFIVCLQTAMNNLCYAIFVCMCALAQIHRFNGNNNNNYKSVKRLIVRLFAAQN